MRVSWWSLARVGAIATVMSRIIRTVWAAAPIRPSLEPNPSAPEATIEVTIVIPARDEAERVAAAVVAAREAGGVSDVVVVDDQSVDDTSGVARAAGARVVDAGERPAGWAGKTWSLQVGARSATTEWMLFVDADVRVAPTFPTAIVERLLADRLDLLSVSGRTRTGDRWAQWLHASMLTTLVYRFGAPGTGGRVLSNGQCVLVRRSDFDEWGGLEPVAGSWVEDVALARWLVGQGRRVAFLDASDLVEVEPYASFADTWSGWGRSLGLPGVDPLVRRALDVAVLALAMPVPLVRLLVGRADALDLVALSLRLGTLVGTRRAMVRTGPAYWCSPLADPLAVMSLAVGVVRRRQRWRGRVGPSRRC